MAIHFDTDAFLNQYGMTKGNDKESTAIHFKSQDSQYRVYVPGKDDRKSSAVVDSKTGDLKVILAQDHDITWSGDDHSVTYILYNKAGKLIGLSTDFNIKEGSAFQVPKAVIKLADLTVELLGAAFAVETMGASEVLAQEVVEDINAICDAFNKVSKAFVKVADDGGRLNFPAVICHNMNKASCAVRM